MFVAVCLLPLLCLLHVCGCLVDLDTIYCFVCVVEKPKLSDCERCKRMIPSKFLSASIRNKQHEFHPPLPKLCSKSSAKSCGRTAPTKVSVHACISCVKICNIIVV